MTSALLLAKVHSCQGRWDTIIVPLAAEWLILLAPCILASGCSQVHPCKGAPEHIPGLGTQGVIWRTNSSKQEKLTPSSIYAKSAAVPAGHQVRPYGQGWCQLEDRWSQTAPEPRNLAEKHCHVYDLCWSQQHLENDKTISNVFRTSLKDCQAGLNLAPHQIIANFHYTPQTRRVKHVFRKVLLLHSANRNFPQRKLSCSELSWLRARRNWHYTNSLILWSLFL